jgi:hypothetical protein
MKKQKDNLAKVKKAIDELIIKSNLNLVINAQFITFDENCKVKDSVYYTIGPRETLISSNEIMAEIISEMNDEDFIY